MFAHVLDFEKMFAHVLESSDSNWCSVGVWQQFQHRHDLRVVSHVESTFEQRLNSWCWPFHVRNVSCAWNLWRHSGSCDCFVRGTLVQHLFNHSILGTQIQHHADSVAIQSRQTMRICINCFLCSSNWCPMKGPNENGHMQSPFEVRLLLRTALRASSRFSFCHELLEARRLHAEPVPESKWPCQEAKMEPLWSQWSQHNGAKACSNLTALTGSQNAAKMEPMCISFGSIWLAPMFRGSAALAWGQFCAHSSQKWQNDNDNTMSKRPLNDSSASSLLTIVPWMWTTNLSNSSTQFCICVCVHLAAGVGQSCSCSRSISCGAGAMDAVWQSIREGTVWVLQSL